MPLLVAAGCVVEETEIDYNEFAIRYAESWSSQDPVTFASFYAEGGTFRVNDGDTSVGRDAIAETAGSFMAAFPASTSLVDPALFSPCQCDQA